MKTINDELKNFDILPVSFLLQGKNAPFTFKIPSFQRGYRWEEKHVQDMLDDIFNFVSNKTNKKDIPEPSSYFLQPLVVRMGKEDHTWEVLDGQQRLTTMRLILSELADFLPPALVVELKNNLYSIDYLQRVTPNFQNPDPSNDLDSFYVMKAKRVIKNWIESKKRENPSALTEMASALYYPDYKKQVKFIWYVVKEENNEDLASDLTSIKVFNRLNKGKISLTSSELIKALFYIKLKLSQDTLEVERFSMEWDNMEKQFEKDDFWYFISDRKQDIGTRMDVLFDYVADKDYRNTDSMEAYRHFQEKYDRGLEDLKKSWEKVKQVYDTLLRWYEDPRIYNYVGYLVWLGMLPQQIAEKIVTDPPLDEDVLISSLRNLIKDKIGYKKYYNHTNRSLEEWEYNSDLAKIRQFLLLFNVEAYNKALSKFPFDKFKKESWDVEHIDSQKDNHLQELEHKKIWIGLVLEQLQYEDDTVFLCTKGQELLDSFEQKNAKDTDNAFDEFYKKVFDHYHPTDNEEEDKHTINNLVLLNSGINRSYKNAPFPCKRTVIINCDIKGLFIPLCTRNVFFKYYTGAQKGGSQLDVIRWSDADKKAYQTQLLETLKNYL